MKILIDINHPAHVHYFRNLAKLLTKENDEVLSVYRDKFFKNFLIESCSIKNGVNSIGCFIKP